jgi:dihydrofolate reductase
VRFPAALARKGENLMGEIIVHEFITLDGVIDSPTWTAEYGFDPKLGEAIGAIMASCSALLLGRKTFEMFAAAWPGRTAEDDPGAPFMNESPKYVVSATAESYDWNNSHVLGPYQPDSIRSLKERNEGDLYVSGSATLVRALLADGLVDELHLFVYPLALGAGKKLFAENGHQARFTATRSETLPGGITYLAYRSAV